MLFKFFPKDYLEKIKPESLKNIENLAGSFSSKVSKNFAQEIEFAVRWYELPENYKIKPIGKLRETIIQILKRRMGKLGVKEFVKQAKVSRACVYRLLGNEHIAIRNFKRILEFIGFNPSLPEEELSIVSSNKAIKRSKEELKQLINSITQNEIEKNLR